MKQLLLSSFSLALLSTTVVAPAQAEPVAPKAISSPSIPTSLTPFHLVRLAYQGYLREAGVPSYGSLISAYQGGSLRASDLVKGAVMQNRLSETMLSDRSFISDVEYQLRALQNTNRNN